MEAICLLEKAPEVIGFLIQKLLSLKFKSALFNEKITDREIAGLLYLPATIIYGLYRESEANPVGVVCFLNVVPRGNSFVYMLFFDESERGQSISPELCNFIKKDLLKKCPTINSIETAVIENPELEKMLIEVGFEKIGTRRRYQHIGEKYLDVSTFYYLCEEE